MQQTQSKFSKLKDLLQKNQIAYSEQWKDKYEFDYVEVMNETYLAILEILPFKDEEERIKFKSMAESFKDYETFSNEVLRIGKRLKETNVDEDLPWWDKPDEDEVKIYYKEN